MKKKILSVILGTTLAVTAFAGCGEGKRTETAGSENVTEAVSDIKIEIVSKGFQHQYWQAVLKGAEQKAKELGVKINFIGPNSESDIADQVQMLQSATNAKPNAIALAALDTNACMDSITQAQSAGIPIIGFDSGVPGAPEGAILANASTDNYAAGALAAEEGYQAAIKDKIISAAAPVRIGVMAQDATGESTINRGLGFIDRMAELCIADGKTVTVEGNDKYVNACKVEKTDSADVIIEAVVPAQVTSELSSLDCQTLLNKSDTICIYGTNQHCGEAMVTGDENLDKFGTGDDEVIGIAFDSGKVIKEAVKTGKFIGAITPAPVQMGEAIPQTICLSQQSLRTYMTDIRYCSSFTQMIK